MEILARIRSNPRVAILTGAILLVLVGRGLIAALGTKELVLVVDGESMPIRTRERTVAAALKEAGYDPGPEDFVAPDMASTLTDGDTIELRQARDVLVEVETQMSWVFTAEDDPIAILMAAGVSMEDGDWLWVDGVRCVEVSQCSTERPSQIRMRRAMPLSLNIDGEDQMIRSAASTLGEALWESGILLHEGDKLTPPAETPLSSHMGATMERSRRLTIDVDGSVVEARVVAANVGEALAAAGVALVGQDYAVPGIETTIPDDGHVKVVRVLEQVLIEQNPIPFGSYFQPAADVEIDRTELLSTGSYGLMASRVRVRLEDGLETDREIEDEWVVREPEPRIVGYGTKIVIRSLNTPDGPIEYWRAVEMFATSYSPCGHGAGPTVCIYITRSGMPVAHGTVALLPEWYEYMAFDQVYVPGYGIGTVGDTGWGIPGRHWIDLAYTDEDFVSWASYVTVYFLTPVPDTIMWILES
jgi:uncharacterized protein YabE (DUF348 family)